MRSFASIALALAAGLLASGCSGGACASSPVVGAWTGVFAGNTDTLTLNSDCSGTSSYCGLVFTFPDVTADQGTALLTVTANNGKLACLKVGQDTCAYQVDPGSTLTFDCGGALLTYTSQ